MKNKIFINYSISFFVLLCLLFSIKAKAEITANFEEPEVNFTKSGISNIRGWAFSTVPIEKIELFIDNNFITNIPAGALRKDVSAAFPQNSFAINSGFSMAFNYGNLTKGDHTASIKISTANEQRIINNTFRVERFDSSFVNRENVDIGNAVFEVNSPYSFLLSNVNINGKALSIVFSFVPSNQQFQIVSIEDFSDDSLLSQVDWNFYESEIISLINGFRSSSQNCGGAVYPAVPPLAWNDSLGKAAVLHSADMAVHNFFSHTGSDGSSFSQRAYNQGFSGQPYGENIAAGSSTPQAAFNQWVNSPGHCANMMNNYSNVVGFGEAFKSDSDYWYCWTLVLGRI